MKQEIPHLKRKTIKDAVVDNDCLTVTFEDGTILTTSSKICTNGKGEKVPGISVRYLNGPLDEIISE